jgi:glycine C-acetyltransferase/8-amino-7-oxononanoate synthase
VGILGKEGRGLSEALGVATEIELQLGTLSKAVGLSGGYVCGSRACIDLLINKARSFIYSTAPPPALAAAAAHVISTIFPSNKGEARRRRLWANIAKLSGELPDVFPNPESAILPLIVGDELAAMELGKTLENQGFLIPAIRYPTVPKGSARLRITLSASHEETELNALVKALSGGRSFPAAFAHGA